MDQLRNALRNTGMEASPEKAPLFPDPLDSAWIALLRQLGGEVPPHPTMGQLVQRSDARSRALKESGRGRDAAALRKAREDFQRDRALKAWSLVKERFAALELSEKAYRALKQEEADPERVLTRLSGARGEELRGAGAARVRDALTK